MTPRKRRQYGTGSVYQRASDGRWFGSYDVGFKKDGSRDRRTVSAKTEAEAKRKLDTKIRELNRGTVTASGSATVKAWAETWLTETAKSVTPNAHGVDRAAVGWITETIGHRRLDRLEPADFRAVGDAIVDAGKSTATAARYQGTLRRMLTAAQVDGHAVPPNVLLAKARTPDVNDRTNMQIEEALACLAVASTLPHGSRWLAAFLQGARINECLGLGWDRVTTDTMILDWQLQPLPYVRKRDRTSGFRVPDKYERRQLEGQMHLVRPKSKAGWRVIPMVPMMADALEQWRPVAPTSPHGLVWPALSGSPAHEQVDRDEWDAIQGEAGVGHPSGRCYEVHEIRHTTATLLASLGVDEPTRVAIMGHSSHASTLAYEHRDLALIRSALEKVAKALRQIG